MPVTVHFRSFLLNPNIPPEGYPFIPYMHARGGASLERMFAGPRQLGAELGMQFHFERIQRAPNTMLAHRLLAITPPATRSAALDELYSVYFERGRDIGRMEELLEVAARLGLDLEAVQSGLDADAGREQVMADIARARENNVQSVPYCVVDERLAFGGAQLPEVIVKVLRKAERLRADGDAEQPPT